MGVRRSAAGVVREGKIPGGQAAALWRSPGRGRTLPGTRNSAERVGIQTVLQPERRHALVQISRSNVLGYLFSGSSFRASPLRPWGDSSLLPESMHDPHQQDPSNIRGAWVLSAGGYRQDSERELHAPPPAILPTRSYHRLHCLNTAAFPTTNERILL